MLAIKEIVAFLAFLAAAVLFGVLSVLLARDALGRRRGRRRVFWALAAAVGMMLVNAGYLAIFVITRVPAWRPAVDPALPFLAVAFAASPIVVVASVVVAVWVLITTYRAELLDVVGSHVLASAALGVVALLSIRTGLASLWNELANPVLRQALAAALLIALGLTYFAAWRAASLLVRRLRHRPNAGIVRELLEPHVATVEAVAGLLPAISDCLHAHFNWHIVAVVSDPELVRRLSAGVPAGACLVADIPDDAFYLELSARKAEAVVIVGDADEGLGLIAVRRGRHNAAHDLPLLKAVGVEATRLFRAVRLEEGRRAEAVAREASTRLATEARLASLRAQINPHFLFNALNAIAALIQDDPHTAERLVEDLSALLRRVLSTDRDLVTIEEELALVDAYVQIEQARFGQRLTYDRSFTPAAAGWLVPALSIQPLVENAVRHGAEPRPGPCRIAVSVDVVGRELVISVRDDGVGHAGAPRPGTGLTNVSERLAALYGPAYRVRFDSEPGAGASVSFAVPVAQHQPLQKAEA